MTTRAGLRRWLAAGTLAAVLGVAGCGSGSLSASHLRARATRICTLASGQTNRIRTPTLPTQGAQFLSRGIAAMEPELTALRRLRPPAGMSVDFRDALTATTHELDALRSSVKGLKAGNDPVVAIKTLQQQLAPIELQADHAWSALDLPACRGWS